MAMSTIDAISTPSINHHVAAKPDAKVAVLDASVVFLAQQGEVEKSADTVVKHGTDTYNADGHPLLSERPLLNLPHTPAPAPEALKNGLQGVLDGQVKQLAANGAERANQTVAADEQPVKGTVDDLRSLPQGVPAQSPAATFDFEKNFQIMTKVMAALLAYAASNRDAAAEFIKIAQERVKQAGEAMEQAARDRLGSSIGALSTSAGLGAVSLRSSTKAARQEVTSVGHNGRLGAEARLGGASAQRAGGQVSDAALARGEQFVNAADGARARVVGDVAGETPVVREGAQLQARVVEADHHQLGDRVVQSDSQKHFARAQYITLLANSSGGSINATGEIIAAGDEVARMQHQLASDTSRQTSEQHAESVTQAMQLVAAMFNVLQTWQRQNADTAVAITGNMRA